MKKLLLFDIDGTLLTTHGTGRISLESALSQRFGKNIITEGIPFSGKTDPQIVREILVLNQIEPLNQGLVEEICTLYVYQQQELLPQRYVHVFRGVHSFIEAVFAHPMFEMGLLTGNLEPTAYLKLTCANLEPYFTFGAFGSDNEQRNKLPPIALERANNLLKHKFNPSDCVIIGDTPLDIACAKVNGFKSIAVATGSYSLESLEKHQPDLLVSDLEEMEILLNFLEEPF